MAKTVIILEAEKGAELKTESGIPVRLKEFSDSQNVRTKKPVFHADAETIKELYNLK